MNTFKIADPEQQLVGGLLTAEVLDRDSEIMSYEESKPYFLAWSKSVHDATSKVASEGNASFGNVRLQHSKQVVGKLVSIEFDDTKKAIYGVAKITDSGTWTAIKNGLYSGFSVGAKLVSSVVKAGKRWLTVNPMEISIVDLPSNPACAFAFAKGAGLVMKVAGAEETPTKEDYADAVKKFMEAPRLPPPVNGRETEHHLFGDAAGRPVRGDWHG